jgi:dipeptidyl aminopeptidase/acylaminoacyl peptidase
MRPSLATLVGPALLVIAPAAAAQGTRADYVRAERFYGPNAASLVAHGQVQPAWLDPTRFWFEDRTHEGRQWVLVDAAAGTQRPLFDRSRVAAALSVAADTAIDPTKLGLAGLEVAGDLSWIRFQRGRAWWRCELAAYHCTPADTVPVRMRGEIRSPDGQWVAYEREGNLWVRSLTSGERVQLTTDGTIERAYGANRYCCDQVTTRRFRIPKAPVASWSPDSRRLVTHRFDERGVAPLAILETRPGRPVLHTYRYAMAGDSVVPMIDYVVIDLAARRVTPVDRPPHPAEVLTLPQDTVWTRVKWGRGGERFFLVLGGRSEKQYDLLEVDAATGKSRLILSEKSRTHVDLHPFIGQTAWRPVGEGREVVWFSERDGWGHLYLIDGQTGAVKSRITEGPWQVNDVEHVDEAARLIYFTARGREPGRDPYHRLLYRVGLDGSGLTLLTPEEGDHEVTFSPTARYLVDTWSRLDAAPVTALRDLAGRVLREVARTDLSRLSALGWPMPIPFTVKARDGVTDLYGVMYRPSTFDSTRKYPVVDNIYPGPQMGPVGLHNFSPAGFNGQAWAELGFLVVAIDALGTPFRSKAFHDHYYGNLGDNGIPDHVAAIRQLAARHSWIDIERVGIFGHSGGGFASARAMLMYPDFFKVAVSSAGNFDQRGYTFHWGEKYQGPLVKKPDGTDSYANQDVQSLAKNLKGKLMLAWGTLDDNVHPNLTLVLVDELIKANKSFDLLAMPNRNHGFASEPYFVRRSWDYFVRHLLGVEPPEDFSLTVGSGQ